MTGEINHAFYIFDQEIFTDLTKKYFFLSKNRKRGEKEGGVRGRGRRHGLWSFRLEKQLNLIKIKHLFALF
jgi:hypothetical protein